MKTVTLCILLATAVACQRPAPKLEAPLVASTDEVADQASEPRMVEFPSSGMTCDSAGAEAVRAWLTAFYAWHAAGTDVEGAFRLVHAKPQWRTVTLERQPFAVSIAPTRIMLNGVDVKPVCGKDTAPKAETGRIGVVKVDCLSDAFAAAIERSKREAKVLGVAWTKPEIALAIADEARWSKVVETIELLADVDVRPAYLAFHGPWPAEIEPPPEALLQEIRAHFSLGADHAESDRAGRGAKCEALRDFMEDTAVAAPERRNDIVAERIGQVWVDCNCEPDIEWQAGLLGSADNPVVLVAKTWDTAGTSVSHPASARWTDIASTIVEASSPSAPRVD